MSRRYKSNDGMIEAGCMGAGCLGVMVVVAIKLLVLGVILWAIIAVVQHVTSDDETGSVTLPEHSVTIFEGEL
jgi:hypothetical protein